MRTLTVARCVLAALGAMLSRPAPLASQGSGEVVALAVAGYQLAPVRTVDRGWQGGGVIRFGFARGAFAVGPELMVQNGDRHRVRALSGVIRLSQGRGTVRPFLVAGAGPYAWRVRVDVGSPDVVVIGPDRVWREVTVLSGSLGAGVTSARRPVQWLAEIRWHRNLTSAGDGASRSLLSAAAGLRVGW